MKIRPKIPIYLEGSNIWYLNLKDYDPSLYKYGYDTTLLVDGDMYDNVFKPWISNIRGYDTLHRYQPTTGHGIFGEGKEHFNYTQKVERQPYYNDKFGADLIDKNTGKFTPMGEAWARAVDALLPEGSQASFYDPITKKIRDLWTTQYRDAHGRPAKTFTNLADYVNYVRNDQILGARHNVFLNRGKRYFYKDKDGKEHWVNPEDISKYTISKDPVRSNWNNDHTIYWDDYELTGPANSNNPLEEPSLNGGELPEVVVTGKKKLSLITPKPKLDKESFLDRLGTGLKNVAPDLLDAIRLAGNLHNNARVYDAVLKGIRPNLQLTYNTYRQVVGDEATKQAYYRRAALGQTKAAQPFTSDADRQMAYQYEAKRIGDELRALGDLADNAEIRRTSDESNQHQWANTQRATEVANYNTQQINLANASKLLLKAQKYAADWTNWDNYLMGLLNRFEQKKNNQEAMKNLLKLLQMEDELTNDPDIIELRQRIVKLAKEKGSYENEEVLALSRELQSLARKKRINAIRTYMAKSGMKLEQKFNDKYLYRVTRDTVEHFRRMSKMTDDSRIKSKDKPIKLSSHPKGSTRKYLLGGIAPFTIYRPLGLGGESAVSTQVSGSGTSSKGEKDTASKDKLDMLKKLFESVKGLPIDVNIVYNEVNEVLARAKAFGEELSTDDIASMYLNTMQRLSNLKYSQDAFDKAKEQATANEALNEYAVTTDGRLVLQNMETGKILFGTIEDAKNKKLNPITNDLLLNIRALSKGQAFNDDLLNVVNNGVGLNKISAQIKQLAGSLGSQEKKIEGISEVLSNKVKAGLQTLAGFSETPNGYYKITLDIKDPSSNVSAALTYIYNMLPNNYKTILKLHSGSEENSLKLIASYLTSQVSSYYKEDIAPLTGKAAKDSNGNSKESGDGLKLDAATALISGKGYLGAIEFNPGTSYAVTVNARHSGFLKKSGENMGSGITMLEATTSTLDKVLDWNKATLGGSRLNPTGYNRIMINNDDVVGVDLPVGSDKNIPDFTMLQKLQILDLELLKKGIEDTSNNWKQVNQICLEIGLPAKYKNDGSLNEYSWNRFAAFLVTADDSVLVDKNAILSDILGVVEDDNVREQYELIILKDNKNYKLGSGFLGLGKQALYLGTVFVPINSNYVASALSGGLNISMLQATSLELKERGYDLLKIATYKPGININEL